MITCHCNTGVVGVHVLRTLSCFRDFLSRLLQWWGHRYPRLPPRQFTEPKKPRHVKMWVKGSRFAQQCCIGWVHLRIAGFSNTSSASAAGKTITTGMIDLVGKTSATHTLTCFLLGLHAFPAAGTSKKRIIVSLNTYPMHPENASKKHKWKCSSIAARTLMIGKKMCCFLCKHLETKSLVRALLQGSFPAALMELPWRSVNYPASPLLAAYSL